MINLLTAGVAQSLIESGRAFAMLGWLTNVTLMEFNDFTEFFH